MEKVNVYKNYIIKNINTVLSAVFNKKKYILVDGYPHTKNFGDALNTPLVEYLSGKNVLPSKNISRFLFGFLKFQNFAIIGSILQWIKNGTEVWGAGFITEKEKVIVPAKIYAVRGPKTREVFLNNNIECPEVYGDPALLFPLIYYPQKQKKYKFGVIPHYYDYKNPWIEVMRKREDVLIIDLMVRYDYQKVIDQILECEFILSSSLHGVIISDAYKVPNRQITLSDKVIGSEFKFADYYLSVGRPVEKALNPINCNLQDINYNREISIDLRKLLQSCPFIVPQIRTELIAKLNHNTEFSHLAQDKL